MRSSPQPPLARVPRNRPALPTVVGVFQTKVVEAVDPSRFRVAYRGAKARRTKTRLVGRETGAPETEA